MKKLVLSLALIISITAFSQTTQKDYNYMKKGYWEVEENGVTERTDLKCDSMFRIQLFNILTKSYVFKNSNQVVGYVFRWYDIKAKKVNNFVVPRPEGDDYNAVFLKDYNSLPEGLKNLFLVHVWKFYNFK